MLNRILLMIAHIHADYEVKVYIGEPHMINNKFNSYTMLLSLMFLLDFLLFSQPNIFNVFAWF